MTESLGSVRKLTISLMLSGTLNVILLGLFFYYTLGERPPTPYCELRPATYQEQLSPLAIDHSNNEVIRYFRKMPFQWLVARLSNTQLVEDGYTQRDLALASMITFHHFDIDRALASLPLPEKKRTIVYGKFRDGAPAELTIYPGLSEQHCEAIRAFASTERWPMTSKGLFLALQKQSESKDSSLVDAFTMTPEFLVVETLFSRSAAATDNNELLNVVLDGSWKMLNDFSSRQKTSQDLSVARRQQFLLDYIEQHSQSAAVLLLKIDGDFASRKLDDARVMIVLELLDQKSSDSERFALSLLTSPRSEQVWNAAARRLYQYAGEAEPNGNQYNAALSRFVPDYQPLKSIDKPVISSGPPIIPPQPAPVKKVTAPKETVAVTPVNKSKQAPNAAPKAIAKPVKADRIYIVQEGDSLWKLSRRFRVDVDKLKTHNQLESNNLRPGRTLKIPVQN